MFAFSITISERLPCSLRTNSSRWPRYTGTFASCSMSLNTCSATCGSKVHMVASAEVRSDAFDWPLPRLEKYSSRVSYFHAESRA